MRSAAVERPSALSMLWLVAVFVFVVVVTLCSSALPGGLDGSSLEAGAFEERCIGRRAPRGRLRFEVDVDAAVLRRRLRRAVRGLRRPPPLRPTVPVFRC